MNDSIKRDNRKALPLFLLVIFIAAIVGAVLGFLVGYAGHSDLPAAVNAALTALLRQVSPWAIPVCTLVLLGKAWLLYRSARRDFAAWDGEDEAVMDTLDRRLSWSILLSTALLLISFFFVAVATAGVFRPGELEPVYLIVSFLVSAALIVLLQQRVVDLTRRMNPEKQGSIYDLRFHKKWLDSCDEAERQEIGRAAYRAYTVTNTACPILWLVMLLLNLVFDFGLMPTLSVLLVWGCLQITYILTCIQMRAK